jgi:hypothetical protein
MSGKLLWYISFDVKEEDESDFLSAVKVVVENSKVRKRDVESSFSSSLIRQLPNHLPISPPFNLLLCKNWTKTKVDFNLSHEGAVKRIETKNRYRILGTFCFYEPYYCSGNILVRSDSP